MGKKKLIFIISGAALFVVALGIGLYYIFRTPAGDTPNPGSNPPEQTPVTMVQLERPRGITVTGTVLSWEAVPNATKYMVYVGDKEYIVTTNSIDLAGKADSKQEVYVVALGYDNYLDSASSVTRIYVPYVSPEEIASIYEIIVDSLEKNVDSWNPDNTEKHTEMVTKYKAAIEDIVEKVAYLGLDVEDAQEIATAVNDVVTEVNSFDSTVSLDKKVEFVAEQIGKVISLDVDERVLVTALNEIAVLYLDAYVEENKAELSHKSRAHLALASKEALDILIPDYSDVDLVELATKLSAYLKQMSMYEIENYALFISFYDDLLTAIEDKLPVLLESLTSTLTTTGKATIAFADVMAVINDVMTIKDQIFGALLTEMPSYTELNEVLENIEGVFSAVAPEYLQDANPANLLTSYVEQFYVKADQVLNFIVYIDADMFDDIAEELEPCLGDLNIASISKIYQGIIAEDVDAIVEELLVLAFPTDEGARSTFKAGWTALVSDIMNGNVLALLDTLEKAVMDEVVLLENEVIAMPTEDFLAICQTILKGNYKKAILDLVGELLLNTHVVDPEAETPEEELYTIEDLMKFFFNEYREVPVSFNRLYSAIRRGLSISEADDIIKLLDELCNFSENIINLPAIDAEIASHSLAGLGDILSEMLQAEEGTLTPEKVLEIVLGIYEVSEYYVGDFDQAFADLITHLDSINPETTTYSDVFEKIKALEVVNLTTVLTELGFAEYITVDLPTLQARFTEFVGSDNLDFLIDLFSAKSVEGVCEAIINGFSLDEHVMNVVNIVTEEFFDLYSVGADYPGLVTNIVASLGIDAETIQSHFANVEQLVTTKLADFAAEYQPLEVEVVQVTEMEVQNMFLKFGLYAAFGSNVNEYITMGIDIWTSLQDIYSDVYSIVQPLIADPTAFFEADMAEIGESDYAENIVSLYAFVKAYNTDAEFKDYIQELLHADVDDLLDNLLGILECVNREEYDEFYEGVLVVVRYFAKTDDNAIVQMLANDTNRDSYWNYYLSIEKYLNKDTDFATETGLPKLPAPHDLLDMIWPYTDVILEKLGIGLDAYYSLEEIYTDIVAIVQPLLADPLVFLMDDIEEFQASDYAVDIQSAYEFVEAYNNDSDFKAYIQGLVHDDLDDLLDVLLSILDCVDKTQYDKLYEAVYNVVRLLAGSDENKIVKILAGEDNRDMYWGFYILAKKYVNKETDFAAISSLAALPTPHDLLDMVWPYVGLVFGGAEPVLGVYEAWSTNIPVIYQDILAIWTEQTVSPIAYYNSLVAEILAIDPDIQSLSDFLGKLYQTFNVEDELERQFHDLLKEDYLALLDYLKAYLDCLSEERIIKLLEPLYNLALFFTADDVATTIGMLNTIINQNLSHCRAILVDEKCSEMFEKGYNFVMNTLPVITPAVEVIEEGIVIVPAMYSAIEERLLALLAEIPAEVKQAIIDILELDSFAGVEFLEEVAENFSTAEFKAIVTIITDVFKEHVDEVLAILDTLLMTPEYEDFITSVVAASTMIRGLATKQLLSTAPAEVVEFVQAAFTYINAFDFETLDFARYIDYFKVIERMSAGSFDYMLTYIYYLAPILTHETATLRELYDDFLTICLADNFSEDQLTGYETWLKTNEDASEHEFMMYKFDLFCELAAFNLARDNGTLTVEQVAKIEELVPYYSIYNIYRVPLIYEQVTDVKVEAGEISWQESILTPEEIDEGYAISAQIYLADSAGNRIRGSRIKEVSAKNHISLIELYDYLPYMENGEITIYLYYSISYKSTIIGTNARTAIVLKASDFTDVTAVIDGLITYDYEDNCIELDQDVADAVCAHINALYDGDALTTDIHYVRYDVIYRLFGIESDYFSQYYDKSLTDFSNITVYYPDHICKLTYEFTIYYKSGQYSDISVVYTLDVDMDQFVPKAYK